MVDSIIGNGVNSGRNCHL